MRVPSIVRISTRRQQRGRRLFVAFERRLIQHTHAALIHAVDTRLTAANGGERRVAATSKFVTHYLLSTS